MPRLCPGCGQPLTPSHLGPTAIDVCLRCSGVWFDRGELAAVATGGPKVLFRLSEKIRALRQPYSGRRPEAALCPVCAVGLASVNYPSIPGVTLTGCGSCHGFWILAETLTRIAPHVPEPPPVQRREYPAVEPPLEDEEPEEPQAPPQVECPFCGAVNPEGVAACRACDRLIAPVLPEPCPKCEGKLRELSSEGIRFAACEGCGGIRIEHGRLGALLFQDLEARERLLEEVRRVRVGKIRKLYPAPVCSRCGLIMFGSPLGAVTSLPIDRCPQCEASYLSDRTLKEVLLGVRE